MTTEKVDAIVIGSGQAGGPLATALAKSGRKTVLIERAHVGGTCINEGCTPTKTMIASARVAYLARRAGDYGVTTGPVGIDLGRVRERKREIVDEFRGGSERRLQATEGLTLVMGHARFSGPRTVQVALNEGGSRELEGELIFINTGTRPHIPEIPGIERLPVLTSTTIMELDQVPARLLVLGGGYIGLEFAQMFRRFGSEVTIIQRGPQLLGREDEDIAQALADIVREDGIELLLEAEAREASEADGGGIALVVETPEGKRTLTGSHLLVATGRQPNTDDLDLAAAGLATDAHGYVRVNAQLETNVPGVYALGDVKGGPAFTHISYDDFRVIRGALIEGKAATTEGRQVPYVVFTDPQLGRIGLSEREARAAGHAIQVATMPMNYVARALEVDEPRGLMKAIVASETGQIVGAAVLGIEGGELMSLLQMAMLGKLPYTTLRDAIFAHPTLAESLNNLFSNLD